MEICITKPEYSEQDSCPPSRNISATLEKQNAHNIEFYSVVFFFFLSQIQDYCGDFKSYILVLMTKNYIFHSMLRISDVPITQELMGSLC